MDRRRFALKAFINEFASLTAGLAAEMKKLDPPPEVKEAHNQYVGNMESFPALLRLAAQAVDSASLDEIIGGIGLAAYDSFSGPCLDLKTIADRHGIRSTWTGKTG